MTENVSSLRSVKVTTPPCAAKAAIPCGLAVRKQHKMLFTASKFESKQIVKERIEGGANEKAVWRLFINCPFVCINFDFFWLNKARQLYMDF